MVLTDCTGSIKYSVMDGVKQPTQLEPYSVADMQSAQLV